MKLLNGGKLGFWVKLKLKVVRSWNGMRIQDLNHKSRRRVLCTNIMPHVLHEICIFMTLIVDIFLTLD